MVGSEDFTHPTRTTRTCGGSGLLVALSGESRVANIRRRGGGRGRAGPPRPLAVRPIWLAAAVDRNVSGSVAHPRRGLRAPVTRGGVRHEQGSYGEGAGPGPHPLDDPPRHARSPPNRAGEL